ncbi:MAG: HAD family hydrolase [Candidatus Binataceae bacterium]
MAAPETSPPVRLWLLDFDGTIAQLRTAVDWAGGRRVLEPYLRSAGAPEELFAEIPHGNLPLYEAYRARLAANGSLEKKSAEVIRAASEIIERIELAGVERAGPLDGAIELLVRLRADGAKLAIVTSNSSRAVTRWFELNRAALPDAIVGRDSMLALKPSPAMLLRALEIFSAAPAAAAFIGDTEADAIAARMARVRFFGIAADASEHNRLIAAGAEQIFASPAALAANSRLFSQRVRP